MPFLPFQNGFAGGATTEDLAGVAFAGALGVLAGVAFDSFLGDLAGVDAAAALTRLAFVSFLGDLAGVDAAAACAFLTFAADFDSAALGDFTCVASACDALGDLRGVT